MAGLRARTDGGHSPPYTSEADSVKQSHGPAQGPPVVPSPVETQYLASLAHRRGRHIRWKETQNVASLQSAECVKQTQRRAGGPPGMRIAEFGMRNGKERQQVVRNKANPPAGGVCSCRDAISCVSGVSAGPARSMEGDAKCCVSTKGRAERASHVAQPPTAGITAEGGGTPCVMVNAANPAKQSQRKEV